MSSTPLRASVTSEAGGVNQCPNPEPTSDLALWTTTAAGGGNVPILSYVAAADLPAPNPIDGSLGAGFMEWTGPNTGAALPTSLFLPGDGNILAGTTYTLSIYVYIPSGSPSVQIITDSTLGQNSKGTNDQWIRLSITHTMSAANPVMALWGNMTDMASVPVGGDGSGFYFAGCLIQPSSTLNPYVNGGGQPGDPVQVLVDGSDTPVTANGLPGYIPTPGDRLLVQRVGQMLEVVQWLSRGTVPYVMGSDLSVLQAQVDSNTQSVNDTSTYATGVSNTLTDYMASNDLAVSSLQTGYDTLSGLGNAGVQEDYLFVGDDPALSSIKLVQISPFVQSALYAGDGQTLGDVLGLVPEAEMGDITFPNIGGTGLEDNPPMTTFYNVFTAHGLQAMPWN